MDAGFLAVEKHQLLGGGLPSFQLDLLGSGGDDVFVIGGHLFDKIGAGFQIIEQDLAVVVGGLGVEQLCVLVDLKGHVVKVDSVTMKSLPNVRFEFKLVGGSYRQEFTTDINPLSLVVLVSNSSVSL